jgi:hypothetical protein
MRHMITGLFATHREVDLVVEHLVQEFGIPREQIQVHALDVSDAAETRSPQDSDLDLSLPELGLPAEAVQLYDAGMRGGGILVIAWVDDDHVGRALDTYREYGATEPAVYEVALSDDQEQRIRIRAYHLWDQAGRPEGRDLEFWDKARYAVIGEPGSVSARAPRQFAGETAASPDEPSRE